MQMYRVKFARELADDYVDVGDAVVCASSRDTACDIVSTVLALPRSLVKMEATRIKPSLYQISRETKKHSLLTFNGDVVGSHLASRATFPGVTENMKDEHWFEISASAEVKAEDENEAIAKFGNAIKVEMSGETPKRSVRDLDIHCDRKELRPHSPAVEQNAIYKFRRIFQGGDTRT